MYDVTIRSLGVTTVDAERQYLLNILKCVCILSLFIWHENHILHVFYVVVSVVCLVLPYLSTYIKRRTIFGKHLLKINCVFDVLHNVRGNSHFLILRTERCMVKLSIGIYVN